MTVPRALLIGSRPRTWGNAFAPVICGTVAAAYLGGAHAGRAVLAVVVSWALICGVNFANDYSDGIRGTDAERSGPLRLTGSGIMPPAQVKAAAMACFAVAASAGIALSLWAQAWWFIALGALCIAAAWGYTGGKNPYGYRGLGEVAVFVFFGLVATLGTQFTQSHQISVAGVLLAVAMGAASSAVNLANNLRDIPSDREAGKITLAVRLGEQRTRLLWQLLSLAPAALTLLGVATTVLPWPALLGLGYLLVLRPALKAVRAQAQGPALIPAIMHGSQAALVWALGIGASYFISMALS